MMIRTYSELIRFHSFEERFDYLSLQGTVGNQTFGHDRYINQNFYRSVEWQRVRNHVIVRDNGCDLGVKGYEIGGEILVHHLEPMRPDDIIHGADWIIDPEYLITTTPETHNAIHYGGSPRPVYVARAPGDTKLWG